MLCHSILLKFTIVLLQVFASSQVNNNSVNIVNIETVTGADSIDSSDGLEDDNSDAETDSVMLDDAAELPSLD